ncbi:lysostaphin resistance A-like protein [Arthrobacter sp. Z1-15]
MDFISAPALAIPEETRPHPPLPYHRLAQQHPRTARWWRPLAVLGTTVGLYAGGLLIVLIVSVVLALTTPGSWGPSESLEDPTNPMDLLVMLGIIALGLPAVILGSRWGGGRRGVIHSIAGRVRWRLLLMASMIVIPLYTLVHAVTFVLAPPEDLAPPVMDGRIVLVFVIVLLLVPLQCAAEEYAFRALPQQLLGTWLRSPLWGILVPVPLFIIGHGYDWVGQIDLAVFAICMGFLVWKSGGIELAIVVHTANNLILFLLAPLSPTSLHQGAVPPTALLLSVPMTLLVTAALTSWVSRTHGLRWFQPLHSPAQDTAHAAPVHLRIAM